MPCRAGRRINAPVRHGAGYIAGSNDVLLPASLPEISICHAILPRRQIIVLPPCNRISLELAFGSVVDNASTAVNSLLRTVSALLSAIMVLVTRLDEYCQGVVAVAVNDVDGKKISTEKPIMTYRN